jgi:hypothetical protein
MGIVQQKNNRVNDFEVALRGGTPLPCGQTIPEGQRSHPKMNLKDMLALGHKVQAPLLMFTKAIEKR